METSLSAGRKTIVEIAIRLAEEGVPIAVIGRACKLPFGEVEIELKEAVELGRLLQLPMAHWDKNVLAPTAKVASSNTIHEDTYRLRRRFGLTPNQANLVALLMRRKGLVRYETLVTSRPRRRRNDEDAENIHRIIGANLFWVRQSLSPEGVLIKTYASDGLSMEEPDQQRLINVLYHQPVVVANEGPERLVMRLGLKPHHIAFLRKLLAGPVEREWRFGHQTSQLDVVMTEVVRAIRDVGIIVDRRRQSKRLHHSVKWSLSPESKTKLLAMAFLSLDEEAA